MANETATLAAYVANLTYEDIPPKVLERAKERIHVAGPGCGTARGGEGFA